MNQKSIWQQLLSLPPEAQKQAADFIAFLQLRYASGASPQSEDRQTIQRSLCRHLAQSQRPA